MIKLKLDPVFVKSLQGFAEACRNGSLAIESHSKSDYWEKHSSLAHIQFGQDSVEISGDSGFYVPEQVGTISLKSRIKAMLIRHYRKLTAKLDRKLGLAEAHQPNRLLSSEAAYDCVLSRDVAIDYTANTSRFDPLTLKPLFKTSEELKQNWFLKSRYEADSRIVLAAFWYSMFSHFLGSEAKQYLEIGAGSGNLASFFHHYRKMKITIVDLPEILFFSSSFLKSIFPEAKIRLPHEVGKGPLDANSDFDFTFLLPSQIDQLPAASFDLAVNTASMQEMTASQVRDYFSLVQRVCRKGALWCNDNRVEKVPSQNEAPIRAMEFPYSSQNTVLVDEVSRLTRLIQLDNTVIRIERIV